MDDMETECVQLVLTRSIAAETWKGPSTRSARSGSFNNPFTFHFTLRPQIRESDSYGSGLAHLNMDELCASQSVTVRRSTEDHVFDHLCHSDQENYRESIRVRRVTETEWSPRYG